MFANELFVPKWFYSTYQYWKDDFVSDREFADAIIYLQSLALLRLEKSEDDIISKFLNHNSLIKQKNW